MKNCLVTKFKGGIEDNSLPLYGEFKMHLNDSTSNIAGVYIQFPDAFIPEFNARIVGDSYFTNEDGSANYGKELIASPHSLTMYFAAGEADVFVKAKYNMTNFAISTASGGERIEMNFSEFDYADGLNLVIGVYGKAPIKVSGDITDSEAIFSSFSLRYCSLLTGSIDNIIRNGEFAAAATVNFADTKLTCNFNAIEGKTTISTFSPGNYITGDIKYHADIADTNIRINATAAPNITGSIEQYVARAISNGKTTGTRTFSVTSPKKFIQVTYQGTSLANNANVPDGSNKKFTWDAQGNVTWS